MYTELCRAIEKSNMGLYSVRIVSCTLLEKVQVVTYLAHSNHSPRNMYRVAIIDYNLHVESDCVAQVNE